MAGKIGAPFGNSNRRTHGFLGTRIYKIWQNMKYRCDNPRYYQFHRYGGRGIKYDPRWSKFEEFYKDMASTYQEHLTLDRVNGDGNYSKENCRWATWSEQKINTKKTRWVTFKGITKPVKFWAEDVGIDRRTIAQRLDNGWTTEKALTTPPRRWA